MQHRLSAVDPTAMTAQCARDGLVTIRRHGERYICDIRARARIKEQEALRAAQPPRDRSLRYPSRAASAERLLLGRCERCDFEAEDVCQLDVDHIIRRIDGGTNDPENLVVLCANCHRLKSRQERDSRVVFDFHSFMAR